MSATDTVVTEKHRGVTERKQALFQRFLDQLLTSVSSLHGVIDYKTIERKLILELESRLSRHEGLLQEFDDIQCQLELELEDESLANAERVRIEFENKYYASVSLAREILNCYYESNKQHSFKPEEDIRASRSNVGNSLAVVLSFQT